MVRTPAARNRILVIDRRQALFSELKLRRDGVAFAASPGNISEQFYLAATAQNLKPVPGAAGSRFCLIGSEIEKGMSRARPRVAN
jgi:hypothetical protein